VSVATFDTDIKYSTNGLCTPSYPFLVEENLQAITLTRRGRRVTLSLALARVCSIALSVSYNAWRENRVRAFAQRERRETHSHTIR